MLHVTLLSRQLSCLVYSMLLKEGFSECIFFTSKRMGGDGEGVF